MISYTLLIDKGDNPTKKGGVFMRVHLPENGGMTMIENTFIDQFMPTSSGDFVKIYLYLMRCAQGGHNDVSVSEIADALNYTESDVKRAMGYWQKQNCLELIEDPDSEAQGIPAPVYPASTASVQAPYTQTTAVQTPFAQTAPMQAQYAQASAAQAQFAQASAVQVPFAQTSAAQVQFSQAPAVQTAAVQAPSAQSSSGQSKIMEFRPASKHSKEEIRSMLFVAESYLGRPLTQSEQETLVYFLNDLGMDIDLIDYLLDYCISTNHTSFRYIKKVAMNWAEQGICSVEQARAEGSSCRKEYFTIFRALGIRDHVPTPSEREYMDRWLGEYAFPMGIILLACERTILQIGKAQLSYTESILKSWHDSNVRSAEDIEALDQAHERTVRQAQAASGSRVLTGRQSAGRFLNFESSGTDWDAVADRVMKVQEEQERMSQES